MLEHAVWLDLVKGRLEKAFLFELVIIVILNRRELLGLVLINICNIVCLSETYLFVQELQIGSALILDILSFICFIVPVCFLLPLFILLFFVLVCEVKVVFSLGFFTV